MLRITPAAGTDATALRSRHWTESVGSNQSPHPPETPQFLGECWNATAHCHPCHHPPWGQGCAVRASLLRGSVSSHGNYIACLKQPVAFAGREMHTLAKEVGLACLWGVPPWSELPEMCDQKADILGAWDPGAFCSGPYWELILWHPDLSTHPSSFPW